MTALKPQFASMLLALEPVSVLYHETFVLELLSAFAALTPQKTTYAVSDLEAFGAYLARSSHGDRQDLLDLINLAARRAEVAQGLKPRDEEKIIFDKNPPLHTIRLHSNHALIRSEAPIFSLWEAAVKRQAEGELGETFIPNQAESILVHLSSSGSVEQLLIRAPFLPLIERLSQGENLQAALEGMVWDDPDIEKQFVRLLNGLQLSGALIIKG
ncbi:MAG: hypothetical protein EOP07_04610 [Proteobacteria bacterium]|nr:MAG: hypothetical protein EOP07_04610 [Pseudomonadota bacterium]